MRLFFLLFPLVLFALWAPPSFAQQQPADGASPAITPDQAPDQASSTPATTPSGGEAEREGSPAPALDALALPPHLRPAAAELNRQQYKKALSALKKIAKGPDSRKAPDKRLLLEE